MAAQLWCVEAVVAPDAKSVGAKELVFNGHELSAFHHEVPTAHELHRFATCRPIKRLGNWCTPIDNQLVAVRIRHRQPTDVKSLGVAATIGGAVDAAKCQGSITDVKPVEHLHQFFVKVIALIALLKGAAALPFGQVAYGQGPFPHVDQGPIGAVNVRLFVGEIGVVGLVSHFLGL